MPPPKYPPYTAIGKRTVEHHRLARLQATAESYTHTGSERKQKRGKQQQPGRDLPKSFIRGKQEQGRTDGPADQAHYEPQFDLGLVQLLNILAIRKCRRNRSGYQSHRARRVRPDRRHSCKDQRRKRQKAPAARYRIDHTGQKAAPRRAESKPFRHQCTGPIFIHC